MKPQRPGSDAIKPSQVLPVDAVIEALGQVELPQQEIGDLITALSARYPSVLRCRREIVDNELPFATEPIKWYRWGRRSTDSSVRPSRCLAYAAADYYLQDAASLLALAACGCDQEFRFDTQQPCGPVVCDLCASPGGKASALLESIGSSGFLLANEPIRSRIAPLAFNLARTGSDRFAISSLDPDMLASTLGGVFDLMVIDAPCSGQALLGRGKQSMSALSPNQIAHSAARQQRILAAATSLLKPGGRLVYSTCTFAEAENESQIRSLIENQWMQSYPIEALAEYASGESTYRLWPHRHGCAGSFAASVECLVDNQPKRLKSKRKRDQKNQRKLPFDLSQWYQVGAEHRIVMEDAVAYAWPADAPEWLEPFGATHSIQGPEIVHRTGRTWKPSHAASLRRGTAIDGLQEIEVDADTARQFLAGAPIPCQQSGWQIVRYQSKPLGWIKGVASGRGSDIQPSSATGKNQLPTSARFAGELSC